MGNADLEMLVAADEEARARIEAAEASVRAELDGLRADAGRRRAAQEKALALKLAHDLDAIRAESDRAVEERRRHRAEFLERKKREAEALLAEAGEAYARIVREGPGGTT
jgi:hypothetical protein